jgi:hypothetical protein
MTLETLADVRELVERHLPRASREKATWRHKPRLAVNFFGIAAGTAAQAINAPQL